MMELSRQEYPALLRSLSPNNAIAVLDDRVKLIGRINLDIADWLAERRRVEETYVQGLRKLAARGPREVSSELGIFKAPWQSIITSMEALAYSHSLLAQKIEGDVERPLKEYQSRNREMQAIGGIQGNLTAIAKEVDSAQKKASKLSGGKSSANKVANASSDVEAANQMWESQAPYVFEQLQALDENRVNHLRDALTQLETHEVDQVERNRSTAEGCLNAILNINTEEEISAFVAKQTANAPSAPEREGSRNGPAGSTGPSVPPSELPPANSTPSRRQPQESTTASPYSTSSSRMGPPPTTAKKSFGGLRRLGTVLGRDKNSKGMDRPPSPDKRSRPGRNPLRRGTSSRQDMQQLDSPPQTSSGNPPSSFPSQAPQLGDPLAPTATNRTMTRTTSSPNTRHRPSEGDAASMPPPMPKNASSVPMTNGMQSNRDVTSSPQAQTLAETTQPLPGQKDAEGYNVPPPAVDDITRAQQEAAATEEGDPSQFRLNIRDAPIREEDQAAEQNAFSTVANTLRSQAATPRKSNTIRGRRDVRNTVFVPYGQSLESAGLGSLGSLGSLSSLPGASAPPMAANTPPVPTETYRGSDAQSVRSAHSVGSTANTAISHPNMVQPGLNASIVETVSATFSKGQVTKGVVIGEMALQHNADGGATGSTSANVRLENFQVLEKVAPNPTFIEQKQSASGEYSANLSVASRPTVAFKYQVHLDDSNQSAHAPVSLSSSWKIEPTQASVILSYGFNPSFVSPAKRSVSLKNVVVFINIEGTRAASCQSKPAGIFSKEKSMIYWKLGDLELDGYAEAPKKLLARFATEGEAKPGNAEAKWEVSSEQAGGLGSGLGISEMASKEENGSDPFADESTAAAGASTGSWKEVPVTRRIISGKYIESILKSKYQ